MEQQYVKNENDVMEIDFVQLACALLRKWKVIVISTVVCTLIAAGAVAVPTGASTQAVTNYTASTSVYYLSTYMDVSASTSHSMEAYLAGDLKALAVSRTVLEGVIDDLGLEMSYGALSQKVSVSTTASTHILTLSVQDDDGQQAQVIAEALQLRFCDYVAQVMDVSAPVVLEDVTLTAKSVIGTSGISLAKGSAIGAVLGLVLSVGGILVCPVVFGFGKSIYKEMKKKS